MEAPRVGLATALPLKSTWRRRRRRRLVNICMVRVSSAVSDACQGRQAGSAATGPSVRCATQRGGH